MGTLLSSGFNLDEVLELSFEHIELSARCIMRHKVKMFEMVMEPIAAGLGSKSAKKSQKKKQAAANRAEERKKQSQLKPEVKDAQLMGKLNMLGFGVPEIPTAE